MQNASFFEQFQKNSQGFGPLKIYKNKLKFSHIFKDNKKILFTTNNVKLDSVHFATKYYFCSGKMRRYSSGGCRGLEN